MEIHVCQAVTREERALRGSKDKETDDRRMRQESGMIEIFIDGLAEPTNPGIGTWGFAAFKDGAQLREDCGLAGMDVTNNFAEYEALVQALKAVKDHPDVSISVMSDSQLLVNQMEGKWKVKKGTYLEKYHEARKLAAAFKALRFVWIPREMNRRADELTRIAYTKYSQRSK